MLKYVFITAIITFPMLYLFFHPWERQQREYWAIVKRTRARFTNRPTLTPAKFAETYFTAGQREIACAMAEILKELDFLEPDVVSRMQPSDRLIDDLGIAVADGLEPNQLISTIEERFGIKMDQGTDEIVTVGQLVDYIEHKLNTRE